MLQQLAPFPDTTRVDALPSGDMLSVDGVDLQELAGRHGTPLYVYDEATVVNRISQYRAALAAYPGRAGLTYAGKAFLCSALASWMAGQGLWIDCTGQGELAIAATAGVPRAQILVHGVNKSRADLEAAIRGAGTIVVDNLPELQHLVELAREPGGLDRNDSMPHIWLRLRPGRAVDTHAYTQTGHSQSKFGMDRHEIQEAAHLCHARDLPLKGLHFHLGSHFRDPEPVRQALEQTLALAAGLDLPEAWALCPGGGLGVAYHEDDLPGPSIANYVQLIAEHLAPGCKRYGLSLPVLQLEPGRSLVAQAGVAIYRVGAVKHSSGRRWLLLDGGMADNLRPALYGARYTALPVRDPARKAVGKAWLAGPYCESGDILIEGLLMPELEPGDLVAIPVSGAYHLSMASNYNGALRPAVIWLAEGRPELIQRRETLADLVHRDQFVPPSPGLVSTGQLQAPLSSSSLLHQDRRESGEVSSSAFRSLPFARYHALGNDYIVLSQDPGLTPSQVRSLCDRHRGLGGDGVLVPAPPIGDIDFALRIFNPDGSEAQISGNGLRIFARYLQDQGLVRAHSFAIWTLAGRTLAHINSTDGSVSLELGQASFDSSRIPVAGARREVLQETIEVGGTTLRFSAVSVGNPHAVVLKESVSAEDAKRWGPLLERHPLFPNGTNVQFVQVLDHQNLRLEIWERGAGQTLGSGSSSAAAAAVARRLGLCVAQVTVHMPGGNLSVAISDDFIITLTGPVTKICEGTIT